jgi:hypothetical protein
MSELAQRLLNRVSVLTRYLVLRHQLSEVSRVVEGMNGAERKQLNDLALRELDALRRFVRDANTATGFERVKSGSAHVRLLGTAQWLSSAFQETEESAAGEMKDLNRQLMRVYRLLRESSQLAERPA